MSAYPGGYDQFTAHADADQTTREVIRAEHVNELGEAIEAIQVELGLAPSGDSPTVSQRLDGMGFSRHVQGSPSSLWTIAHTFTGQPSITVVDSAGSVVIGDVTYTTTSQITVEFSAPFAGEAFLS